MSPKVKSYPPPPPVAPSRDVSVKCQPELAVCLLVIKREIASTLYYNAYLSHYLLLKSVYSSPTQGNSARFYQSSIPRLRFVVFGCWNSSHIHCAYKELCGTEKYNIGSKDLNIQGRQLHLRGHQQIRN